MLAFVFCAICYIAGEYISNATKAWVPSVFVTAAMMLVGYWTIFPNSLVADSNLIPFGSSIAMYLIVTHMGTVISFKQLFAQWKTIERAYLMGRMFAPMIVGGFTTVTITSVIIAGIFVGLL